MKRKVVADTKWCPRCKRRRSIVFFSKNTSHPTGLQHFCKECMRDYRQQRIAQAPQETRLQSRARALRRKYGITVDQYQKLLDKQLGVCAICGADPSTQRWGYLHVDHDHDTGKIRGLLCLDCNAALGLFRDNPTLLKRAIRYLRIQP